MTPSVSDSGNKTTHLASVEPTDCIVFVQSDEFAFHGCAGRANMHRIAPLPVTTRLVQRARQRGRVLERLEVVKQRVGDGTGDERVRQGDHDWDTQYDAEEVNDLLGRGGWTNGKG